MLLDSGRDPFAIKITETSSKTKMQSEDYMVVVYQFPEFGGCISFIQRNVLVCGENMFKYSVVITLRLSLLSDHLGANVICTAVATFL